MSYSSSQSQTNKLFVKKKKPCFVGCKILETEPGCLLSYRCVRLKHRRWRRQSLPVLFYLKYHCNARGVSYVFELLDVRPDVIALILILSRHDQREGCVNVCHSEGSRFLVDLWDLFQYRGNCFVSPAKRWNLPTPKTALVLSSGPAYSSLVSFPLAVCSTTLMTYLLIELVEELLRSLLCQSVLVGVSPILTLKVTQG